MQEHAQLGQAQPLLLILLWLTICWCQAVPHPEPFTPLQTHAGRHELVTCFPLLQLLCWSHASLPFPSNARMIMCFLSLQCPRHNMLTPHVSSFHAISFRTTPNLSNRFFLARPAQRAEPMSMAIPDRILLLHKSMAHPVPHLMDCVFPC